VADLRAGDDGFGAHGAEAGEEGREEGAQAGDCGGHYCVEDFGLAADGGGDAVEGLVGGMEFDGEVVDLEAGEGDYSGCLVLVGMSRLCLYEKIGCFWTYGNLKPKAKRTLSFTGTAVWRPHTRWTAMPNRPTSVAMSRAAIAFHWAKRELHFAIAPNWTHGSLKSQRRAASNIEATPVIRVTPRAYLEIFLWTMPEEIRLNSRTTLAFEA
jgi:hypothetical protein